MDIANTLEGLVTRSIEQFEALPENDWLTSPDRMRWTRKEILGHLIDSAVNNLRRFCEAQYMQLQPYKVQPYKQDELVRINQYREAELQRLLILWSAINMQIVHILKGFTQEEADMEIIIPEGELKTVGWLADDYVVHMQHHLTQILGSTKTETEEPPLVP